MENRPNYTIEEYVRLEKYSNLKHEFYDGQIWAMGGGSLEHSRLAAAIIASLTNQLQGRPFVVYTSDARVRVVATGLDTYPDVTVRCGPAEMDAEDPLAQVNPTVLIEVTSPTSEKYDRGSKFAHYKLIPSLREYVLVSQNERTVDVWRRGDDDSWVAERFGSGQRARLTSIACALDVDEIYLDPSAVTS